MSMLNKSELLSVSAIAWHPNMPIFSNEILRGIVINGNISIFSDDIWNVYQGSGKPTVEHRTISFANDTGEFKDTLKRIVWCSLNMETPIELLTRPNAARSRLTIGSVGSILLSDIRPFVLWLEVNGFTCMSDVTTEDLRRYSEELSLSSKSRANKARKLFGPTRIWLLAPYLPIEERLVQPPWENEGLNDLLGPAKWSGENKTPPIHPQSMSPLINWAIKFVNELSEDILDAIEEKNELDARFRVRVKDGDKDKYNAYLAKCIDRFKGVPGCFVSSGKLVVAKQYMAVSADVGYNTFRSVLNKKLASLPIVAISPLEVRPKVKVNGNLWVEYFDYYEVDNFRQLLAAACIIVISYLSGMRVEECRALRRGCCKKIHLGDDTYRFEIWSRSFKSALDVNGNAISGGRLRETPWHVIQHVHQAISVMEKLHEGDLLFSDMALNIKPGMNLDLSLQSIKITHRLSKFIDWCNSASVRLNVPELIIPPDPDGNITLRRFRRTLAWFIYRLPGGRISLGIQYGHLRGITTDGYGSRVSTGLRDTFPLEEAYAIADSLHDSANRLASSEGVSGPSADKYIAGVLEFSETYKGKYLTLRQASQLSRNPSLRIFDNGIQPVACCYDMTKALCHPSRATKKEVSQSPDLTRCNPACQNLARTDKHIEKIKADINWQEEQFKSELTPLPLKERHQQHIAKLKEQIYLHESTKIRVKVEAS